MSTKISRPIGLLFAVLAIAAPGCAVAQSEAPAGAALSPQLVVNVDAENPPFMSSRGGYAVGLYPAILRVALARCHDNVHVEAKPWKRAFAEIDKGLAGIGGLYKNAERLARYDFSDPIHVENIAVYYRRAKPVDFRMVADLYGKRVGVLRGWSYGGTFDAASQSGWIATEEVSSDRSNFLKLMDGRLDAVLAIAESGTANLGAPGVSGIEQADVYLASYPVHLAFHKKAGQGEVLACFNKTLAEMKRDGMFDRIVREQLGR